MHRAKEYDGEPSRESTSMMQKFDDLLYPTWPHWKIDPWAFSLTFDGVHVLLPAIVDDDFVVDANTDECLDG